MVQKSTKHRYTPRDHVTAYLVVLLIIAVIVVGALVLYLSGIFDPIEVEPALSESDLLELPTAPPRSGLLQWLIPAAAAEEAPPADGVAAPDAQTTTKPEEGYIDLESLLQEIQGGNDEEEELVDPAEQVTVAKGDLAVNPNLPDNVYNMLLLATDSRNLGASRGRSDVMIVASINMTTNEVKLTSMSRDMYVTITEGVGKRKLNAAYAYGGPELAMKTINNLFELNIQDYALVNFESMAGIVDAIGGVDIYLEPQEYIYINENVAVSEDYEGFAKSASRKPLTEADQETVVHLDGLQAVGYARIRKLDSDIYRGSRQRVLLQAIMEKAIKNLSPSTFYGLATSLMSSVSTNLSLIKVIDIGKWVLDADEVTMQEMSVPVAESWHYSREDDVDVIIFNQQTNTEALHAFVYGEYIPAKAQ